MRALPRAAGLAAALAVLAATAGCTAAPAPTQPEPTTAALPQTAARPAALVLDAGITVATGVLGSVDGMTSGSVSVVSRDDGIFDLVIDGFSSPVDNLNVNISTEPFDEQVYCEVTQTIWVLDAPPPAPTMRMQMGLASEPDLRDPSFLDTVVLTIDDADAPRTGCFYPVVATAELVWTMPDLRPDLAVVDSGHTGGATGMVMEVDGVPQSYRVASGDLLPEIAARLGITVDDLFYLSPTRRPNPRDPAVYVDEVLNLDPSRR